MRNTEMENKLNHRYIARLIVVATTPLFVGSGDASLMTDSLVQKDHNGLPMIPGTSLAGVLRHSIEDFTGNKVDWKDIFGYQDGNDGLGSRLKVSSAYFLKGDKKVAEGITTNIDEGLLNKLDSLPTRQHVRITDKGVAADNGLFDNEVVYKGAKFIFEIELKGLESDRKNWEKIIDEIKSPAFRVGQGTRNGYGNLKVTQIFNMRYDLNDENDFNDYLEFNPFFNASLDFDNVEESESAAAYTLQLQPDDFFIFSEGFGDEDVDNKPVMEEVMTYQYDKIEFEEKTLIPASSVKGAIAHRVCFHYNKNNDNPDYNKSNPVFADKIKERDKNGKLYFDKYTGEENPAVARLFGKKGRIEKNKDTGQRGILILDDLYFDDIDNNKIFNHVAIDRFTGGAIDGALFSEKVSYKKDKQVTLKIYLSDSNIEEKIREALENALTDICKGLLPLGGMTTKGFGMFTGKLLKGGIEIFDYNKKIEV